MEVVQVVQFLPNRAKQPQNDLMHLLNRWSTYVLQTEPQRRETSAHRQSTISVLCLANHSDRTEDVELTQLQDSEWCLYSASTDNRFSVEHHKDIYKTLTFVKT